MVQAADERAQGTDFEAVQPVIISTASARDNILYSISR
jgi:hypothetical protein